MTNKQNINNAGQDTNELDVITEDSLQSETANIKSSDIVDSYISENEEFKELVKSNNGSYNSALFEYCFKHNLFYNSDIVKLIFSVDKPEDINNIPMMYTETLKADYRFQDLTFFSQIKRENFEKIYSEELSLLSLDEEDKKNRQQIISIIGSDPFKDEKIEDRPQLYRDLTGMLTDNMRKDIAKSKAAVSIVRSYQNIDKYQKKVNELMGGGSADEDTQELINNYLKLISTIQTSINQTAEKNNFTVKGIGSNGHGMLSDVMNQIEGSGIDEGITNFYDIATSKSIEEIANISWKAQLNQLNLSKTDYVDILQNQCEIVREAQSMAKMAEEALRLAKEKIVKQRLLDELADDYRAKGVSEEDIVDFINREYKLFDGTE